MFSVAPKIRAQKNTVAIISDTVHVVLAGPQTAAVAKKTLEAFVAAIARLKGKQQKAYVFVDLRSLKDEDVTSEARLAIKVAFRQPYDALAAVGNSQLMEVAMYLMKAGDASLRARYFTSHRRAVAWLQQSRHPRPPRDTLIIAAACIVATIGTIGLIGWTIDWRFLTSLVTDLRPINPMAAAGLLVLGVSLLSMWMGWRRSTQITSAGVILLGVAALTPLGIDNLLFGGKVAALGAHTELADSAALCFITIGLTIWAISSKLKLFSVPYTLVGAALVLGFWNLFGILYAKDFMYALSGSFVMALPLALAFVFCGSALLAVTVRQHKGYEPTRLNRTGWLIIAALLSAQIVTYTAWQQGVAKNQADAQRAFEVRREELQASIQNRIQAYIDSLYGFRGLFAASDSITESEFNTYYNAIGVSEKYPGLRAVSYITRVETKDLPAFVAERRQDTSAVAGGHPSFIVQRQTDQPIHYVLTYLANNTTSPSLGVDFSSNQIRQEVYEQAIRTGNPVASGTIEFAASATAAASRGFFITVPLQTKTTSEREGDKKYIGLVSTVFNYDDFFANLFSGKNKRLLKDVDVIVRDNSNGSHLLVSDNNKQRNSLLAASTITVANRSWQVYTQAPKDFASTASQESLPRAILWSGQLLSVLLVVIFLIQNQARRRALRLADAITADLQVERNRAVTIQQKDEAILSSIGDAVFAVDTEGTITLFNPAAAALSGYSTEEAIGKHYDSILKFELESTGVSNYSFILKALKGELASMENHTVIVRKNGSRLAVADSAAPIRDLAGNLTGAIVVFRDVSTEYELDRAKTEFVSLASHQLRTPLSAINWYSEILLANDAGKLNEEQHGYLQEIHDGNQRMIELVNALLDVSRLDLGKLSNEPTPIVVNDVIQSLNKELATAIISKKLTMNLELASKLPALLADPKLVRMIIQNLLSNAVKYTPDKGTVTTITRLATATDFKQAHLQQRHAPYLFFSVTDTGYGIPKAQQDKIFSKLFRADNVRALDVEGTGLGLYIVKEVVEKLGGKVWFNSVENHGTTFTVVMPFTTTASNDPIVPSRSKTAAQDSQSQQSPSASPPPVDNPKTPKQPKAPKA